MNEVKDIVESVKVNTICVFKDSDYKPEVGDTVGLPFNQRGVVIEVKDKLPWGNHITAVITKSTISDLLSKEEFLMNDVLKVVETEVK